MRFPPIAIHEAGEKVPVPEHIAHAAAWRVAAELIRRHPNDLYAIELHPSMGQHHHVGLYVRQTSTVAEPGRIYSLGVSNRGRLNGRSIREKQYPRFHWLDVLFAYDFRTDIIEVIERGEDLPVPVELPPITRASIGPQVIAAALAMRAFTDSPLVANNGVYDSSGMGGSGVCREYFMPFGSMIDEIGKDDSLLDDHPAYRFWFLHHARAATFAPPIAGIDTWKGMVWTRTTNEGNLMHLFKESGDSVEALTVSILN